MEVPQDISGKSGPELLYDMLPSAEDAKEYTDKLKFFYNQFLHFMNNNKEDIQACVTKRQIGGDQVDLAIKVHDIVTASEKDPITVDFLKKYEDGSPFSINVMEMGVWNLLGRHKYEGRYDYVQRDFKPQDVVKQEQDEINFIEKEEPERRMKKM